MKLIALMTVVLLFTSCASVPSEHEVLSMSDQEFRLWVREAVKDLRTGQWVLVGIDVVETAGLFILLPKIVEHAAAKGAARAVAGP